MLPLAKTEPKRPSNRLMTGGGVLAILSVVAALCLLMSWLVNPYTRSLHAWLAGALQNLGAGVVASAVTFVLIDLLLERERNRWRAARHEEERMEERHRAEDLRRKRLAAQIRSGGRDAARSAVEELRSLNWLYDGSLSGADFSGSDLRSLDLSGARLQGVLFIGTDLREGDLRNADISGARFRDADLRGTRFDGTVAEDADFDGAQLDDGTVLPDKGA